MQINLVFEMAVLHIFIVLIYVCHVVPGCSSHESEAKHRKPSFKQLVTFGFLIKENFQEFDV